MGSSNAAELYKRIKADSNYRQLLFRKALQDPQGALEAICEIGEKLDLLVSPEEVKAYLESVDDDEAKQWLIKARGGL